MTAKSTAKKAASKPAEEKVDAQSTDEIEEAAKHPHELMNPILSSVTTRDLNPAYAPGDD